MKPSLTLLVSLSCSAGFASRACAQPCQPHYADMGPSTYIFAGSYYAVFDDGSGPSLYRGNFYERNLIVWTPAGWQPVNLAGTPPGFEPLVPMSLADGTERHLYLMGSVANSWYMYKRIGATWQPSGICYRDCPPFQYAGPVMSADFGTGSRIYGIAFRQGQSSMVEVVRSDPGGWTSLGTSDGSVKTMVVFDDGTGPALYAVGDFTTINGVDTQGLAKWNGLVWSSVMPPGTRLFGRDMTVVADLGDGPAIYINGTVFYEGIDHWGVSKWDGQEWTFLGAPDQLPPPSTPRYVNTIAAFDDGRGMALYIGGLFQSFAGVPARNVVRWTGTAFEPLGAGIVGEVFSVTGFLDQRGPALHISGGSVTGAGAGTLQQHGVLWVGCPSCYANCDLSTRTPALNVADFICFLNKYAAKDPYANCTVDAVIDIADFTCFLTKFAAGCP